METPFRILALSLLQIFAVDEFLLAWKESEIDKC